MSAELIIEIKDENAGAQPPEGVPAPPAAAPPPHPASVLQPSPPMQPAPQRAEQLKPPAVQPPPSAQQPPAAKQPSPPPVVQQKPVEVEVKKIEREPAKVEQAPAVRRPHWTDEPPEEPEAPVARQPVQPLFPFDAYAPMRPQPESHADYPGAAARRAELADVGRKSPKPEPEKKPEPPPETTQAGSMGIHATDKEYEASQARVYAKMDRALQSRLDEQTHRDEVSTYKVAAEEQDARKKLTAEISKLVDVRRKERVALEQMAPEERVVYLGQKEAERQQESGAVKAYAAEATGSAQEKRDALQAKNEDYAERAEARDARRAANEERRAEERDAKEVQRREAQQQRDEDYVAKLERRDEERAAKEAARAEERDAKELARREAQQAKDEDYVARLERKDAERASLKAKREDAEADRLGKQFLKGVERDEKAEVREAEKLGREFVAQNPEVKAVVDAQKAAEKKAFDKQYEQARRKEDPEYAKEQNRKETQKDQASTVKGFGRIAAQIGAGQGQGAAPILQGLSELGGTKVGKAAGITTEAGAALGEAAGIAGPIAAAVQIAVEKVKEFGKQLGDGATAISDFKVKGEQAVVTFDSMGALELTTRKFGDVIGNATDNAGLFGMVIGPPLKAAIKGNIDEFFMLAAATKSTAERLAQYDPNLAAQNANQEVAQIMRELARAQRFSQDVSGANEARFSMEMKLGQITDRFIPFVMAFAEKLFTVVERLLTEIDEAIKEGLKIADGVIVFLAQARNWIGQIMQSLGMAGDTNSVHDLLQNIHNMIQTALAENTGESSAWSNFFNAGDAAIAPNYAPALPAAPVAAPLGL